MGTQGVCRGNIDGKGVGTDARAGVLCGASAAELPVTVFRALFPAVFSKQNG